MSDGQQFPDSGMLLARVSHVARQGNCLTFLFGSALTAPGARPEELGVRDANALVEEVVESFRGSDVFDSRESILKRSEPTERYQVAMKFMIDCCGQDSLNELIKRSVLKARCRPLRAFRRAAIKWRMASPSRARQASEAAARVREKLPVHVKVPEDDSEFDRTFTAWLGESSRV